MIVAIRGGLGNQLFQAAFARFLKAKGNRVFVDTRDYPKHDRVYMLEGCGFDFQVATDLQCDQALWRAGIRLKRAAVKALAKTGMGAPQPGLVLEKEKFEFDPALSALPDHSFFDGLWMNIRYIEEADFSLPLIVTPLPEPLSLWQEKLQQVNTAAVHIRRGDYAQHAEVRKSFLVCDHGYYKQAMTHLADRHENCKFMLFSDDPDYVAAQNWHPFEVEVLPAFPGIGDEQSMRLLSTAHHQILSNSTFSWWGAYLNRRPGKTVIVPDRWQKDLPTHKLVGKIIPTDWVCLPAAPKTTDT